MLPPLLNRTRPDLRKMFGVESSEKSWRGKDILIVVGQNGSGKSMLRRMFAVACGEKNLRLYDFSQQRRGGSGIETAVIYGDESWQSTGCISLDTVIRALKYNPETLEKIGNARGRSVTPQLAFRVARLAGASIDDLLGGRFRAGACPRCGYLPDLEEDPAVVDERVLELVP